MLLLSPKDLNSKISDVYGFVFVFLAVLQGLRDLVNNFPTRD